MTPEVVGTEMLEAELRALGRELVYPPTPDLATRVGRRVAPDARDPRTAGRLAAVRTALAALVPTASIPRVIALALIALLLAAGVVTAVGLGLRGLQILFVPALAPATGALSAPPAVSVTAPASVGARLGLGAPVTLDEARRVVEFGVLVPALPDLVQPDAVYVGESPVGGQVAFVYAGGNGRPRPIVEGVALVITQFEGSTNIRLVAKELPEGATVETVQVGGRVGYWITGEPHNIVYVDDTAEGPKVVRRLAANTLVWERDGVILRIESALAREEAVRLAESLR